jgi:hypothetical protein
MINHDSYEYLLNNYLNCYPDADEYEFVIGNIYQLRKRRISTQQESEFSLQELYLKQFPNNDTDFFQWCKEYKEQELNKIDKNLTFFQTRLNRINPTSLENEVEKTPRLKWTGNDLELSETLKALIQSQKFVGNTDKKVFEVIFELFSVKFTESIKKERLSTIKKRTKDYTRFINEMEINLTNWINKKDD